MNKSKENQNRSFNPKKIGETLNNINTKLSNKFGKIEYIVYKNWKQIVGPFFSDYTEPYKITKTEDYLENSIKNNYTKTLHVNVSPSAAIEFQHLKDKIIEKINSYFGYKAIENIKIYQNYTHNEITKEIDSKKKSNVNMLTNELKKHTDVIQNKDLEDSVVNLGLSISKEEIK